MRFFKLGYGWGDAGAKYNKIDAKSYFTWSDGGLGFGEGRCFTASYKQELTYNELMELAGMQTEFTKDDLISGEHIVECRNGKRLLVVSESFLGVDTFDTIARYSHNLTNELFYELDIVKVFELNSLGGGFQIALGNNNSPIWQREEKTAEQIKIEELEATIKEAQKQISELKELNK